MRAIRCRQLFIIAEIGLMGLIAGLPTPTFSLEKVTLKTDFSPVGYHTVFYAAVGRGIYQQHGLDVDVIPGNGSYTAVLDIAGEKVDFGFADTGSLVVGALNANIRNVKVVSMIFEVTPYTVLYLKNKGITKPQDLKGKTMADFQGSGTSKLIKVFARVNGVDLSSSNVLLSSPSTFLNPLIVGQADYAATTVNRLPNLIGPARQSGNDLAEFRFADYGVDIFGASIIANVKTIERRMDVVKRFVRATLESVQWTAQNSDQAVDYFLQFNPQIKKAQALIDLRTTLDTSVPRGKAPGNPLFLGWTDAAKMKTTIDMVREAYELRQSIDPTIIYTNEYVAKP